MIDEETNLQIDAFLNELKSIVLAEKMTGDFTELYSRYPKVRIGIRRAMFFVDKQIRNDVRQKLYENRIPDKENWDWFTIEDRGIIRSPCGKEYTLDQLIEKWDGKEPTRWFNFFERLVEKWK